MLKSKHLISVYTREKLGDKKKITEERSGKRRGFRDSEMEAGMEMGERERESITACCHSPSSTTYREFISIGSPSKSSPLLPQCFAHEPLSKLVSGITHKIIVIKGILSPIQPNLRGSSCGRARSRR